AGWQAMDTAQLRYNWADPDVYEAFMGRWSEHLASQFLNRVNVAPGMRAGHQLFWPNGQAALWRKIGLADVTEVPVVVDCEYASFADYWATFTGGPGSVTGPLMALSDDARGSIEQHVRAGYLVG